MKKSKNPWAVAPVILKQEIKTNFKTGLSSDQVQSRLKENGENKIVHSKKLTFWNILLEEIKEPIILLLIAIAILYSIWGDIGDTILILSVIITVTLVEVYTEYRAKKSIESLKTLAKPTTWVMRDSKPIEITTSEIVLGDILILKSGVKIGADARIIESHGIMADESQLTGESMGISKVETSISENTGLNDRINMVHMGSVILKGKGLALVIATGMDTEIGKIAGLTEEAREPKTPLQKSMKQLSKSLVWVAIFFSIAIPLLGILRGLPFQEMILTGLAFAFATIPEEMPIIITMILGLGSIRLSKKNVLIKRTKAAETLGSVTVIATDKTGTLTENKMSIENYYAHDEQRLFTLGTLMADISYGSNDGVLGDPMDKSLVDKAKEFNIDRNNLLKSYKLIKDYGFNEEAKTFESIFESEKETLSIIKGAPESIFSMSAYDKDMVTKLNEMMFLGLRTIAVASKKASADLYTISGLISFEDPIRQGVPEAIKTCKQAGVIVMMITGDHADTAKRVAENAGIEVTGVLTGDQLSKMSTQEMPTILKNHNVFARITPEQKLSIVTALRENDEVVAVTGDGINDAPALKSADIGISMGISGTDVAKEAADMILTNDDFASIVIAIEEGRCLYDNLSKCVKYYLACKIGLIFTFLIPTLLNIPLPFSPIQIIILELFMDLAASTSFVVETAEGDVLNRKPRNPKENFMNKSMITGIFSGGLILGLGILAVYLCLWLNGTDIAITQTLTFVMWLFGQIALALNMRTSHVPVLKKGVFSNRAFNIWMSGVIIFLIVVLNVPLLMEYLQLTPIGIIPILCLALISILSTSWLEVLKFLKNKA